jgi:CRISPR-associated protein Cas1
MPRKKRETWIDRRPIPWCQVGVLHAFGPGRLQSLNSVLEFKGSEVAGARRLKVPLRGLKLVCLYGPVHVTPDAIELLSDAGAAVAYLSSSGLKATAILQPTAENWRTRRYRQYMALQDQPWMLRQARRVVAEKLKSFEAALEYSRRQGRASARATQFLRDLPRMVGAVENATDTPRLLGLEGIASRRWFEVFASLLPAGWSMPGRRRRPPTDAVNALLSLGYTLVHHRMHAACQAWGLDASLGFYHEYRRGRPSLAWDLVEPFRVNAVDRLVLRMLARKRYNPEDFVQDERDNSVKLVEGALQRWLMDLEMNVHAATEDRPSLHVLMVERVRELVDELPSWPGQLPDNGQVPVVGTGRLNGIDTAAPPQSK